MSKIVSSTGMAIDHDFYGGPIKYGFVTVTLDKTVLTDETVAVCQRLAQEKLHSMAERMPHRYWRVGKV